MKQSARWTLTVSADTDRRVRRVLDAAGRKGDLSRFVEEAVRSRLLELSMKSVPTYSRPSANDVEQGLQDLDKDIADERNYGG
jgi:hypothetical protein